MKIVHLCLGLSLACLACSKSDSNTDQPAPRAKEATRGADSEPRFAQPPRDEGPRPQPDDEHSDWRVADDAEGSQMGVESASSPSNDDAGDDPRGDPKAREEGVTPGSGPAVGTWFTTCGDPVCSGYDGPWPGVPACGKARAGDPCGPLDLSCDPKSSCNARLICAETDPKQRPGGCPISRRRFKRDLAYLDEDDIADYYAQLRALRLASYRYRERADGKLQLGVILEDNEDAVWVDAANDRVDLYAYSSLAIAGVQAQAQDIEALQRELAAVREELARVREQAEACDGSR